MSYAYDLVGKPTSLTDTLGNSITNVYDLAGRLTSTSETVPGLAAKTIGYTYNAAGNVTRLTWPDAYYVSYAFDAMNRMIKATANTDTAALATFNYETLGRLAWVQYAGTAGAKVSYSWTVEDDLVTLTHALTDTANDVAYTNTYTPAHQILSAANDNASYDYAPLTAGTTSYVPDALNRYDSVGGISLNYDLNGNLTSDGAFSFAYDPENRLMTAAKTGTSVAYAYDPMGRRTAKTVNGTVTYFLNSGDDEIAEYANATSGTEETLLRRFVPGPGIDRPIAMVTAAGVKTFFHQDKSGSVIAMSDTSGNLATDQDSGLLEGPYTYDAYGNCVTGSIACSGGVPYKYTGRRYDPETELYYYRARYYSSAIGRFLQTDPVGYKDGINWYAYVGNDPTDKTDPSGLEAWIDVTERSDKGYDFAAYDDQGHPVVFGTFNTTTQNENPLRAGEYRVSPRPHIQPKSGLAGLKQKIGSLISGNREGDVNRHEGQPIISNTGEPGKIQYSDGEERRGATIHGGRDENGNGGRSLGCLVTDKKTLRALMKLLGQNYDKGGVHLTMPNTALPQNGATPKKSCYTLNGVPICN